MKIELKPGNDRNDHFYAIKDRKTGKYLNAHWYDKDGQETCRWFEFENKLSKLCTDGDRAQARLAAVRKLLDEQLDAVINRNPPSRWRIENIDKLTRLLQGDLLLVRIDVSLKVLETPK